MKNLKRKKNVVESLTKELTEIKEKNKINYKKIDDSKNKEHRLNRELQQANDRINTLTSKLKAVTDEKEKNSRRIEKYK